MRQSGNNFKGSSAEVAKVIGVRFGLMSTEEIVIYGLLTGKGTLDCG
jgi:hypothetical protein